MTTDLSIVFASKRKAAVVAPAGCGKTELIVRSTIHSTGRQLILTHTHAGIKSLKDRFKKYGVKTNKYSIDTISGFALRYSSSFPQYCGLKQVDYLYEPNWAKIYVATKKLITSKFCKIILTESYAGIYVDEYQDCTLLQHELIELMSAILPTRIVGDPLQGIFDFNNEEIVNWGRDIFSNYERLDDLNYAWRWHNNPRMGEWISSIREKLIKGEEIDLSQVPEAIRLRSDNTPKAIIQTCFDYCKFAQDKIVAIHKWPAAAHKLAQKLNGSYVSMEEVEAKDLMKFLKKLSELKNEDRVLLLLEFASKCMIKISSNIHTMIQKLQERDLDIKRIKKNKNLCNDLISLVSNDELNHEYAARIISLFKLLSQLNGVRIYRKELYDDFIRTLKNYSSNSEKNIVEVGRNIRNRYRVVGRVVNQRVVSRILLIKGLEFDHAIFFNVENSQINAKELYVGLTRASKSLTIFCSNNKIIKARLNI